VYKIVLAVFRGVGTPKALNKSFFLNAYKLEPTNILLEMTPKSCNSNAKSARKLP